MTWVLVGFAGTVGFGIVCMLIALAMFRFAARKDKRAEQEESIREQAARNAASRSRLQ